jgi:GNAT superfamily N-acetyltransferase
MEKTISKSVRIRPIEPGDAETCGRSAFEAHQSVAKLHNFPPEHPNVEFSIDLMGAKLKDPRARGWLAERGGTVVGSIFVNDFAPTPVAAIGPLTVHPEHEGGVGRALMQAALDYADSCRIESVRLVQSPSHLRSLALYAKLGFDAREPLLLMRGRPQPSASGLGKVRVATEEDTDLCNALCEHVHGFTREPEFRQASGQGTARVIERDGRICGYATAIGLRGHAVGETPRDIVTLISKAPETPGPGFFLPLRNGELLRWALRAGLTAMWPALLMTRGRYQEPTAAFLPSIAF